MRKMKISRIIGMKMKMIVKYGSAEKVYEDCENYGNYDDSEGR